MQSIIVYRNPLEAAFWESASGAQIFPVLVGIVVFFAVFLLAQAYIVERFTRWNGASRVIWTNVCLFASGTIALAVVAKMWL